MSARLIMRNLTVATGFVALASPVFAQAGQVQIPKPDPQVTARYQLAIMADVLERAVQQGARLMTRQMQGGMSRMLLIGGDARARGFRLEGFGIFFDVDVPAMSQSVVWSWRTLDLTGGGAAGAIEELKNHLKTVTDPAERKTLDQAIRQLELQLNPAGSIADSIRAENAPRREGQATVVAVPRTQGSAQAGQPAAPVVAPPMLPGQDPNESYTVAVREALVDAMLRYSQSLALGADEWLVVAARDRGEPGIGADDPYEVTTIQLRIKGADLQAFHAGRLTPEEARKRVEVKEY